MQVFLSDEKLSGVCKLTPKWGSVWQLGVTAKLESVLSKWLFVVAVGHDAALTVAGVVAAPCVYGVIIISVMCSGVRRIARRGERSGRGDGSKRGSTWRGGKHRCCGGGVGDRHPEDVPRERGQGCNAGCSAWH